MEGYASSLEPKQFALQQDNADVMTEITARALLKDDNIIERVVDKNSTITIKTISSSAEFTCSSKIMVAMRIKRSKRHNTKMDKNQKEIGTLATTNFLEAN